MEVPSTPADEAARLETLRALALLDTDAEERLDPVTRIAQRLFGVPVALVSLIDEDRQWFKSRQGAELSETPREISFCGHAILGDEFAVLFVGTESASTVRKHLRDAVEAHNATGPEHPLGYSAGVVTREPGGAETLDELVRRADAAMYEHKRRDRPA